MQFSYLFHAQGHQYAFYLSTFPKFCRIFTGVRSPTMSFALLTLAYYHTAHGRTPMATATLTFN